VVAFCANADGAKAASSAPPPSKLTPYLFIASPDPLRASKNPSPQIRGYRQNFSRESMSWR
jgi:hypothetical protein